jgi:quinol-cytochrome oxidoreductase complex cytochrome b subunit
LAAGLGLAELRAIMRGEPPTESPNPRDLAHTLSLLLHLRPRYYYQASTRFTHTFRLGYFTMFFFAVEVITGLVLMVYYNPTPEGAYASILHLMREVPFGDLLRDVHRLAAEAMVVCAFLHMVRTFVTASYKGERAFIWLTGVGLLIITLGLAFSGYLLPWDQLAYWAVTIGTSMVEAVPLVGREVNLLLRGAPEIGGAGLLRFYLLHVVLLPLVGILFISVHYYRIARRHGISLPADIDEGDVSEEVKQAARRRISFIPDLLRHEIVLASVATLALIAACWFVYDAPLEHHADPRQTPLNTQSPWFFLWVQGLLKLGDKTVMGVIVPAATFAVLFALPYLDRNPYRRARRRPIALALGALAIIALMVLSYMGTHYYGIEMPDATRIVEDLAPGEGVGPLRSIPYDDLVVGAYPMNKTDAAALPPTLAQVFADYEHQINQAANHGQLPDARALLIIEERQYDLKRITLRITWSDAATGEYLSHERVLHVHRQRHPGTATGSGSVPTEPVERTGAAAAPDTVAPTGGTVTP